MVPFHLPSTQVVAGKTESVKDVLGNHLRMQKSGSWTTSPKSPCDQLCAGHPDLLVAHGHVASSACLLNVSGRLREILRFSAATEVSPPLQYYKSTTSHIVQQWMRRNGLNSFDADEWDKFVTSQWELHVQSAWTTVKRKDLMYFRQLLRGFVVHGRDHAINEVFIFCPFMY